MTKPMCKNCAWRSLNPLIWERGNVPVHRCVNLRSIKYRQLVTHADSCSKFELEKKAA